LKELFGELVDKLLPAVSVDLWRNAEFAKLFIENGLCHGFCLLVLDCRDEHVFDKCVRDAQDLFVLATSCQHWAEKISMDPDVRAFRIW
jgi:hypothetical protein